MGYAEEEVAGRCAAILANGTRCPNAAIPGSRSCGLPPHQALKDQEGDRLAADAEDPEAAGEPEVPPVEDPPAGDPPAEDPPVEDPPVEDPRVDEPPVDEAPGSAGADPQPAEEQT